jgi:DNA-binding CsgD family transcriptional regulator
LSWSGSTTFDLDEYVYEALRAGASGFLLKDAPELVATIRVAADGGAMFSPSVTRRLSEEFTRRASPREVQSDPSELTPRETEVLRLIAAGLSNQEIAAKLVVGEHTAKTHVAHILQKLDLRDRVQAVVLAMSPGSSSPVRRSARADLRGQHRTRENGRSSTPKKHCGRRNSSHVSVVGVENTLRNVGEAVGGEVSVAWQRLN